MSTSFDVLVKLKREKKLVKRMNHYIVTPFIIYSTEKTSGIGKLLRIPDAVSVALTGNEDGCHPS